MRSNKKWRRLLTAWGLVCALALAGCGGSTAPAASGAESAKEEEAVQEETETEAKAESKAAPTEATDPTEAPAEEAAAVSSTETPGVPNEALFGTWMRDSAEDNTYEIMWINEDGTMNIRKVDHDGNEVARTMGTYSI